MELEVEQLGEKDGREGGEEGKGDGRPRAHAVVGAETGGGAVGALEKRGQGLHRARDGPPRRRHERRSGPPRQLEGLPEGAPRRGALAGESHVHEPVLGEGRGDEEGELVHLGDGGDEGGERGGGEGVLAPLHGEDGRRPMPACGEEPRLEQVGGGCDCLHEEESASCEGDAGVVGAAPSRQLDELVGLLPRPRRDVRELGELGLVRSKVRSARSPWGASVPVRGERVRGAEEVSCGRDDAVVVDAREPGDDVVPTRVSRR